MSQTAIRVWFCEEDVAHMKAIGIPLEWAGDGSKGQPPMWEYYIMEHIYQQIKMWSTSGTQFAGITLEAFLRTLNDTSPQDKECTTTSTTTST